MPWSTPTLEALRGMVRDNVQAQLRSGPMVPNSVARVMSDSNAGLAYLTLLYIDWLAKQLMPDTSEKEWLDRHAAIWIPPGRKKATFATLTATATGIQTTPIPGGTQLTATGLNGATFLFQTTADYALASVPTPIQVVALTPGETGLQAGNSLSFNVGIAGVDGSTTIASIVDGVAEETDDELRVRVLDRIQEPPMGGDAEDYVQWALRIPGVTRVWPSQDMGIGTVTVRFMMDDLRATDLPSTNGFPLAADVINASALLNVLRPVALKDFFVLAPIPYPIEFTISGLNADADAATRQAIEDSVSAMLKDKAAPATTLNGIPQEATTIYASWVNAAIMAVDGVDHFDLIMTDIVMPNAGSLAVLGTIFYV